MAQDVLNTNLSWTGNHIVDLHANIEIKTTMTITTLTTLVVELTKGESVIHFDVVSTEGSWPDARTDGSVLYHVTSQGSSGTVLIERVNGNASATFDMTQNSPAGLKQKVIVENIITIQ
jgi:hypothetical protein